MKTEKGWIAIKSFKHKRQHLIGDVITDADVNPMWHEQLEKQGCIRWVERPAIIMPKEDENPLQHKIPKSTAKKPKKNVRKGKGKV